MTQTEEHLTGDGIQVQDDISITIRPAAAWMRNLAAVFLAACGFIGTIAASLSMFSPIYNRTKLILVATAIFILYSIFSVLPGKLRWLTPVSLAVGTLGFFWKRNVLITGFQFFYNHFYQQIYDTKVLYYQMDTTLEESTYTTFFLICCIVFLAAAICWFTIHRPFFPIGFIVTFFPIELGLYNGLELSLPAMALVLLYWASLLAMQLTSFRYAQEQREIGFFRKGNRFTAAYTMRTTMAERCGMIVAGLMALVFLLSWGFFTFSGVTERTSVQQKRKEIKNSLQTFDVEDLQDSLSNVGAALGLTNAMRVQKLGRKRAIDIQNEPQLQLTFDQLPDSAMYLKSFTGTTYDDNAWTALKQSDWDDQTDLVTLSETFLCYPQLYPYWFQNYQDATAMTHVDISALKWERRCYVPYASYQEQAKYEEDFVTKLDSKKNYSFTVSLHQNFSDLLQNSGVQDMYLQREIFNATDSNTQKFLSALSLPDSTDAIPVTTYFQALKEDGTYDQHAIQSMLAEQYLYRPFVYEQYTQKTETDALQAVYDALPASIQQTNLNPDLSAEDLRNGAGENLSDQLAVLESIRQFLADNATYSTSPGKTPGSRDFVNYFLMENHEGYCVHFATAGVLLARYAGIPARYCEGYVATPSDFEKAKQKKDGSYTVTLTDARAHAWCEFYVTGYGWIPFEFTPGYYGGAAEPEEGTAEATTTTTTTAAVRTEIATTEQTTEQTIGIATQTTAVVTSTPSQLGTNSHTDSGNHSSIGRTILRILLVLVLLAAVIAAPFLLRMWALQKRTEQFHAADRKKAILWMYAYWERLLGTVSIRAGNESVLAFSKTAAQKLQEQQLPSDNTAPFCELVSAVNFGGATPSAEACAAAEQALQQLAEAIYQAKSPLQKLYFKYIQHLI